MTKWFWRSWQCLTAIVSFLFCGALLGRWWWIFDLLTNLWPQYFALFVFLGLGFLNGRRWRWAGWCFSLAAYNALWLWPYFWPAPPAPAPTGETLTILASNVYQHGNNIGRLRELVAERNPDIVILMEMIPDQYNEVHLLAEQYPYFIHEPLLTGNAVFSRIPPEEFDVQYWDGGRIDIKLKVRLNDRPLLLIATHARAARSGREAHERNLQLADMRRFVQTHDEALVIAGDLNVTPWSSYYRNFITATNLRDQRLGRGVMPTWPIMPAPLSFFMMPFDHLLTTPDVAVYNYERTAAIGSDHYPLWIELGVS